MRNEQKIYNKLLSNFIIYQAPNYFEVTGNPMLELTEDDEIKINCFPCKIEYVGNNLNKDRNIYEFMRMQKRIIKKQLYSRSKLRLIDLSGLSAIKICIAKTYIAACQEWLKGGIINGI